VSICLSAMPGCGNYSLRLGEEDKVLQDDAVNLALSKAKSNRRSPSGMTTKKT